MCYDEVLAAKDFNLLAQGVFNQEIYRFISSVYHISRKNWEIFNENPFKVNASLINGPMFIARYHPLIF